MLEGWVVVRVEVIEPHHPLAALEQRLGDGGADEAGGGGEEGGHSGRWDQDKRVVAGGLIRPRLSCNDTKPTQHKTSVNTNLDSKPCLDTGQNY